MNRLEVIAQVASCTDCSLSETCTAPVYLDGPTPADLAVVGEAPTQQEDVEGKPFSATPGLFLKQALEDAGFDLARVTFMNAVSCHPVDDKGNTRAPNAAEIKACQGNLRAQMDVANAKCYLLTGAVPLKAIRPGLKISVARGVPFLLDATRTNMGDRLALPTFHPAYILRAGGKGSKAHDAFVEDIAYLRRLVDCDPKDWISLFPETCVLCDAWASRFDDDGIGWCEADWNPDR